jgi:hypothetical protein
MWQGWRKQGTWPSLYPLQDEDIMIITQIIGILRPDDTYDSDGIDNCDDDNDDTNNSKSTSFFLSLS